MTGYDRKARRARQRHAKRTILFLDEIHRFNRSQQDVFLPYVEGGDVVLVGATTENPSFELNGALLSRCKVVVLEPLPPEAVARIVERALLVAGHRAEEDDRQRFGVHCSQRLNSISHTSCGHRIEPGNHWHGRSRQMQRRRGL